MQTPAGSHIRRNSQHSLAKKRSVRLKETMTDLKEYSAHLEVVLSKIRFIMFEFFSDHDTLTKKYAKEVRRG